jgi:predicted acyltransferase (DUF342 family)
VFALAELVDGVEEELRFGLCRNLGAGKLDFLSMASTVLWKRRNSASARMSVDSRSIVVDNSLTVFRQFHIRGDLVGKHTVFKNFVEMLQMLHYYIPMLLQDGERNEEVKSRR